MNFLFLIYNNFNFFLLGNDRGVDMVLNIFSSFFLLCLKNYISILVVDWFMFKMKMMYKYIIIFI